MCDIPKIHRLVLALLLAAAGCAAWAQSRAPWPRGSTEVLAEVTLPGAMRVNGTTQGKTFLKLRFLNEGLEWDGPRFAATSHSPYLLNNSRVPRIRSVQGEVNPDGTRLLFLECSEEIFWDGRPSYKTTLRISDFPVNSSFSGMRGAECPRHIVRVTEEGVDAAGTPLRLLGLDWSEPALAELNVSFSGYRPPKAPEGKTPAQDCGTPEQKLEEILHRYRQQIPKGPCANGMINNVRSIFDHSLDGFRCGGYQGKVLDLLDHLRESRLPYERCLVEDFDYGPIEIGVGLHQAVVIYRKGTDWKNAGLVLDPWFNQTPETYPILQWQVKSCISLGGAGGCTVNGASLLGGWTYYPTVGAPYPGDAGKRPPAPVKPGRIAVNCPLIACLVDAQGRASGYRQGQTLNQIPGVAFMGCTLADGSPWTEFEFSPQPGLRLALEASDTGQATVVASLGQGGAWQYQMPLRRGDGFSVALTAPRSPMKAPQGEIPAGSFGPAEANALAPRLQPAAPGGAPKPAGAGLPQPAEATRDYRHPEGGYRLPLSMEWNPQPRKPDSTLDLFIRTPDRDQCALYFGRDHEDAARKGIDASLESIAQRIGAGASESRTERIQIGAARGILISNYDAGSKAMTWHLCLGHAQRIYYVGIETLAGSGRRELPGRIRELLQGMVF